MIYKVGILGGTGRVGLELSALLSPSYEWRGHSFELSDVVSKSKKFRSIEGVDVRTLEDPPREPVHVWIDFSRPEATLKLLRTIQTPVVIGTTGFSDEQLKEIRHYAENNAVLLASNTSPGLTIVKSLLESMPDREFFPAEAVLSEDHHRKKVDSPSGTAKTLLNCLKAKGHENVQIHVTRAGQIAGTHQVRFITDDEEIEITHRVSNRRVFAKGAIHAAAFLLNKNPGFYDMKDVFAGGTR